jgi:hypothetical protein
VTENGSGSKKLTDDSDVIEKPGAWFFPPVASLITSGGRLLLAMTEACIEEKRGTYLFCDTDSCAIVASKSGGRLHIPGGEGKRILSWDQVKAIIDKFGDLNPYDRNIVKGSILNLVDANFADSDPTQTTTPIARVQHRRETLRSVRENRPEGHRNH